MAFVIKYTEDGFPYFEESDEEGEEQGVLSADVKAQLAQLAIEQEAETQTRSPLRDILVEASASAGIDEPPEPNDFAMRSYEDIVGERTERRRARLEEGRNSPEHIATRDYIDAALDPTRQAVRGALGTAMRLPWDIGSALTSLVAIPSRMAGYEGPADAVGWMQRHGKQAADVATTLTGAEEVPRNIVGRTAKIVGESAVPYGKNAALATALISGVRLGTEEMKPSTVADLGQSVPDWLASAVIPSARAEEGQFDKPSVTHTKVESVGGPTTITTQELATIGGMAAASLGMIFAPQLFSKFKFGRVPKLRSVDDTAPGTMAMSTVVDLARTYDDANAGALRIMHRAGLNPAAAREVEKTMRIQTRATANALTDSAVNVGRMEAVNFTFQSRVPLSQLAKAETPQAQQYLHVMDTIDDLKSSSLSNKAMKNPQAVIRVRGMTLADAWQLKQNLERAHPEVVNISKAYRDNLKATRQFQSTGEYGTLPIKGQGGLRYLNANRPNTVPFKGEHVHGGPARVTGEPVERGSAVSSLAENMRVALRERMENEAIGLFVDQVRKARPELFVRVTAEQLKANPNWAKNTVTFKRRGIPEYYTTDEFLADVLRMDPYYMQSMIGQLLYSTKRMVEIGTTGELAPWFAATSLLRSWQIGKLTTPEGRLGPTLAGSLAAVPRQLYPQMAQSMSRMLNNGSSGWLGSVLGQGNLQSLSTRLAHQYDRSLFAQLQTVGGGRGSILQQQVQANNRLTQAIQSATSPKARAFLEGYRSILNAVHNAPAFNYASKNVGRASLPELGMEARHLTGDPRIGGQYYTGTSAGHAQPIRFANKQSRVSHIGGKVVRFGYGVPTEIGRTAAPWFNATTQGIKRIGEAYLENPAKFTGRLWLYQIMPAGAMYFGARALGNDPNGQSYVDYMMNRRSEYARVMNNYIPIPGRPAEEGIEFPRFHEAAGAAHLATIALDHAFRSAIFSEREDFTRAFSSITGAVLEPPAPPAINLALASQGLVGPQGVFAGEAYRKRVDPFDQNGGLPSSAELYLRAIAPGIGDIIGTGYAAYTQTPEGVVNGLKNAATAVAKRGVSKTPLVRDIFNVRAPSVGNTRILDDLFKKQRAIRELERYYKRNTVNEGLIGIKPRSQRGEAFVAEIFGERPPMQPAGLPQPKPTNPLYNMFMEEVHKKFVKDEPTDRYGNETGAIGFLSMWQRFGIATDNLRMLRKINDGNNTTWQQYLAETPEQTNYLRRNNVDPRNLNDVRNFYERQRQYIARTILFVIRGVENDFSERLGKPIKIEDLDPYGKGLSKAPDSEGVTEP